MSKRPVRRPTEDAALYLASRSARPEPTVWGLLDSLATALSVSDRKGAELCARRVVRTVTKEWPA